MSFLGGLSYDSIKVSSNASPIRQRSERVTLFSKRDIVGWLARSAPVRGNRSHAIFKPGSDRAYFGAKWPLVSV